jgi:hypothetical protein
MATLLPGFVHHPGVHCGSTALVDAAHQIGLPWSEPLVFGLASGLGFYYLLADGLSPSRMFLGRSGLFEQTFVEATGLDFPEASIRDSEQAWRGVKELLDGGEAVILKADIRYLPYYQTQTEFNGHKIVAAGYDEEGIFVADTHFSGLQKIGHDDLRRTMSSAGAPVFWPDCMYGPLRRTSHERPLAEAIPLAIGSNAERMLKDDSGFGGVPAIERFAAELPRFREREDASWIARFGYQVIEKRGTGGGFFRKLYGEFLHQAAEKGPVPAGAAQRFSALAERWSAFGMELKAASEDSAGAWDRAAELARELARLEREAFLCCLGAPKG